MDYYHPEVIKIRSLAFDNGDDVSKKDLLVLRKSINNIKDIIKNKLIDIIDKKDIKYLSIENALSIPLNIPLGIALSEIISEKKIRAVTRHHDLYWEREEFLKDCIQDILDEYFPPNIERLEHVVINTIAQRALYSKKKIRANYVPNAFDFEVLGDFNEKNKDLRHKLDMGDNDYLFLQPTRIIQRKKIERSIKLVQELSKKVKENIYLFITGKPEKDEISYFYKIKKLSEEKKINLILSGSYGSGGGFLEKDLFKLYNIYNMYNCCDLVTLPSDVEGFGNPVIEACAFRKPLFVNNYPVLMDMLSKGFDFIVIDGEVNSSCIEKVYRVLTDDAYRLIMLENNYKIAKRFYSMKVLIEKLKEILN